MTIAERAAGLWALGLLVLASTGLPGCAGSDFTRPASGSFALGRSTQAEVLRRMGTPYSDGEIVVNGTPLRTLTYLYSSGLGSLQGSVTPARSQGFYFQAGRLVGTEFVSSYPDDSTDFDERRVPEIIAGISRKVDVVALMGAPGGEYITPLVKEAHQRALVYLYEQTKGTYPKLHIYRKRLVVSCDEDGVVTDVSYSTKGTRD